MFEKREESDVILLGQASEFDAVPILFRVAEEDDVVVDVGNGGAAKQQVDHLLSAVRVGAHQPRLGVVEIIADTKIFVIMIMFKEARNAIERRHMGKKILMDHLRKMNKGQRYRVILKKVSFGIFRAILVSKEEEIFSIK